MAKLVLLREPDGEVINGRVYFVMTRCFYLFCSVYRIEGILLVCG